LFLFSILLLFLRHRHQLTLEMATILKEKNTPFFLVMSQEKRDSNVDLKKKKKSLPLNDF